MRRLKLGASQVAHWLRNSPANTGDVGLIPELERSPGGGNGYPLHYSCLKNSKDREAWRVTVHGGCRVRHDWRHTHIRCNRNSLAFMFQVVRAPHCCQLLGNLPFLAGFFNFQFSLVAQSCPTLCDPMNHSTARPPCPSATSGVHSDSHPSSQWCHPAISSSLTLPPLKKKKSTC